jgi:hypothetical protein
VKSQHHSVGFLRHWFTTAHRETRDQHKRASDNTDRIGTTY